MEQDQTPKELGVTGKAMLTLMKLSMDEKIQEQSTFMWEDEIFVNCLRGMKAAGIPFPEKVSEVQAFIRLVLAANETIKVKRLLDYEY